MARHRTSSLCGALLAALALPLTAETIACNDPTFMVLADTHEIRERTCRAASRARETLATCSVEVKRSVEIRVRDRVESEMGECFGLYHCGDGIIEILSPNEMSAARDRKGAFAAISEQAYWESILAHELTHAAYDALPCPHPSCLATSEYASYAMQVWSLPDKEKDNFGSGIELMFEPTPDAINTLILAMAPDRFALIAWRHFQAQEDPCAYLDAVMQGEIFFDIEPF